MYTFVIIIIYYIHVHVGQEEIRDYYWAMENS